MDVSGFVLLLEILLQWNIHFVDAETKTVLRKMNKVDFSFVSVTRNKMLETMTYAIELKGPADTKLLSNLPFQISKRVSSSGNNDSSFKMIFDMALKNLKENQKQFASVRVKAESEHKKTDMAVSLNFTAINDDGTQILNHPTCQYEVSQVSSATKNKYIYETTGTCKHWPTTGDSEEKYFIAKVRDSVNLETVYSFWKWERYFGKDSRSEVSDTNGFVVVDNSVLKSKGLVLQGLSFRYDRLLEFSSLFRKISFTYRIV